jgi:hypothetical protein
MGNAEAAEIIVTNLETSLLVSQRTLLPPLKDPKEIFQTWGNRWG